MKKVYLTLLASLISGYCFSQSPADGISSAATSTKIAASVKPALHFYPNPAKNKISLQVSGFEPGMAVVKIIDLKGNQMRADNRLLISGNEEVVMFFSIPPGIYFIMIRQKDKLVRKKLVVV